MEDKITRVRNYVLDQLEAGNWKAGGKLPGARVIAASTDVSLLTVQNALETLVNEGVLEAFSRKGTFVAERWDDCVLQNNFRINNPCLPWVGGLKEIMARRLPKVYACAAFDKGVLELRPTLEVQARQDQYLDLAEMFARVCPDRSDFFMEAFDSYYGRGGILPGIPFIFSPRVMFYNRTLLREAGCPEPRQGWSWSEFLSDIRRLRQRHPEVPAFNWNGEHLQWLAFVLRSGGAIFDPTDPVDPVRIDAPLTRHGLRLFQELHRELCNPEEWSDGVRRDQFAEGRLAFMLAPRQELIYILRHGFDDWGVTPLPVIPGGCNVTTQATDLICVRKSCANLKQAEAYVELMLSSEVQDFIAAQGYGIPIRKSSAFKALDVNDERDGVFLSEIAHMSAHYNIDSVEIRQLILDGIDQIWSCRRDLEEETAAIAAAIRTFIRIRAGAVKVA